MNEAAPASVSYLASRVACCVCRVAAHRPPPLVPNQTVDLFLIYERVHAQTALHKSHIIYADHHTVCVHQSRFFTLPSYDSPLPQATAIPSGNTMLPSCTTIALSTPATGAWSWSVLYALPYASSVLVLSAP
eukprot:7388691-Prymnesium_polylepis.1